LLRIPPKPAIYSDLKSAAQSDLKPARGIAGMMVFTGGGVKPKPKFVLDSAGILRSPLLCGAAT
jgi:hypothetical protein